MHIEEIDYIITHFPNLISEPELIALKHYFYADELKEEGVRKRWYLERKWATEDPEIVKLLDDGYDQLRLRAASKCSEKPSG